MSSDSAPRTLPSKDYDPLNFSTDRIPVEIVPIALLRGGISPRLAGQNSEHAHTLAQAQTPLPPILVHRRTMRIVDGMHRVEAARLRGETQVEVRFFDGYEADAFVLAVQANTQHGLPLTLADRTAAANRILALFPDWSDRAIARTTGLSPGTVGAIRRRASVDFAQSHSRVGFDGRRRPNNPAEARREVSDLISRRPEASLREIARTVGVSTATVRDVRRRLAQGYDPVPPRQLRAEGGAELPRRAESRDRRASGNIPVRSPGVLLERLRKDPSLRFSETGRKLLRWLAVHVEGANKYKGFLERLPPHSSVLALEMARSLAHTWASIADELEKSHKVDSAS